MTSNKDLMRERKAAYLASTWQAAGGDADTLQYLLETAQLGLTHPWQHIEATDAARLTLSQTIAAANARYGKTWQGASITTWSKAIRKLQLQEQVVA